MLWDQGPQRERSSVQLAIVMEANSVLATQWQPMQSKLLLKRTSFKGSYIISGSVLWLLSHVEIVVICIPPLLLWILRIGGSGWYGIVLCCQWPLCIRMSLVWRLRWLNKLLVVLQLIKASSYGFDLALLHTPSIPSRLASLAHNSFHLHFTSFAQNTWFEQHAEAQRQQHSLHSDDSMAFACRLSLEWHKSNPPADGIALGSNARFLWCCPECEYEYEAVVSHRSKRGSGCPECARNKMGPGRLGLLKDERPDLAEEYDDKANSKPLDSLTCGSEFKAAWKCKVCKNSFQQKVRERAKKNAGCPLCASRERQERKETQASRPALKVSGNDQTRAKLPLATQQTLESPKDASGGGGFSQKSGEDPKDSVAGPTETVQKSTKSSSKQPAKEQKAQMSQTGDVTSIPKRRSPRKSSKTNNDAGQLWIHGLAV